MQNVLPCKSHRWARPISARHISATSQHVGAPSRQQGVLTSWSVPHGRGQKRGGAASNCPAIAVTKRESSDWARGAVIEPEKGWTKRWSLDNKSVESQGLEAQHILVGILFLFYKKQNTISNPFLSSFWLKKKLAFENKYKQENKLDLGKRNRHKVE